MTPLPPTLVLEYRARGKNVPNRVIEEALKVGKGKRRRKRKAA